MCQCVCVCVCVCVSSPALVLLLELVAQRMIKGEVKTLMELSSELIFLLLSPDKPFNPPSFFPPGTVIFLTSAFTVFVCFFSLASLSLYHCFQLYVCFECLSLFLSDLISCVLVCVRMCVCVCV